MKLHLYLLITILTFCGVACTQKNNANKNKNLAPSKNKSAHQELQYDRDSSCLVIMTASAIDTSSVSSLDINDSLFEDHLQPNRQDTALWLKDTITGAQILISSGHTDMIQISPSHKYLRYRQETDSYDFIDENGDSSGYGCTSIFIVDLKSLKTIFQIRPSSREQLFPKPWVSSGLLKFDCDLYDTTFRSEGVTRYAFTLHNHRLFRITPSATLIDSL